MSTTHIFFDLDGTLLDTARDFAFAINVMLARDNKPALNFDLFREHVHGESRKMIAFAFGIDESQDQYAIIRDNFLGTYYANCTKKTVFFDGIPNLLDTLDANNIPWGIVTSKPSWLAKPILAHFQLDQRAACIVMGDTVTNIKPHPEPLLHACKQLSIFPENAIYVGDLHTDILAAKTAKMKSVGVTYGYHPPRTNFFEWNADVIVNHPVQILTLIVPIKGF